MMTEKTLRAQLKASGLDAATVDRLVKSEVAAGNVAEEGLVSLSIDDLIDAVSDLRAAADVDDIDISTSLAIHKGGPALAEDTSDMLRGTALNVESLVSFTNETMPALVKGSLAQGKLVEQLVDYVASLSNSIDEIKKSLNDKLVTTGAPRGSVSAAKPHPNDLAEQSLAKSAAAAQAPSINRSALQKALVAEQSRLMKGGASEDVIVRIGEAVSTLENSALPVEEILKRFDINVTV